MLIFKRTVDLQKHLRKLIDQGVQIGFTPTMGALHQGHLSLLRKSLSGSGCTVCSIFVNPTQFNDPRDLDKYPRTTSADIELLQSVGCDILFLPAVKEIYPNGTDNFNMDFGYLDQPMEGAHRPGHFAGMAQVVSRLLEIVGPNQLFMGQKDYQQAAIVREMLRLQGSAIELVVCPIIREQDGLAMSSRNVLLTPEQRNLAPFIHQVLHNAKKQVATMQPKEIELAALKSLNRPGMAPEYFEIVDGITLRPISDFKSTQMAVACTAVKVGAVRLIDNMVLYDNL